MKALVVGQRISAGTHGVREALERAATGAEFVPNAQTACETYRGQVPRCVIADAHEDIRELSRHLRMRADCFGVPLLAVVDHINEQVLLELRTAGADDVVARHDVGALTRRLSALRGFDPKARVALSQGACLLSSPHPRQRQLVGRLLRQAGFNVSFASDTVEALQVARGLQARVVVVSEDIEPNGGLDALARLFEQWERHTPAVVLSTGPTRMQSKIPVVNESAPPDDLLFVINELLRPRELVETRASRRLLYATQCAFRAAGEFESRVGLTYNISGEGLYVRTLDAPATRGPVWLEFRPPFSREACHLRGEVVWVRALTTGAHGATPPGFGVRLHLDDSPPEDRARYEKAYERLAEEDTV